MRRRWDHDSQTGNTSACQLTEKKYKRGRHPANHRRAKTLPLISSDGKKRRPKRQISEMPRAADMLKRIKGNPNLETAIYCFSKIRRTNKWDLLFVLNKGNKGNIHKLCDKVGQIGGRPR